MLSNLRLTRMMAGIVAFPLLIAGCASLNVYQGLKPGKQGVTYRLPRGVLLVSAPVTKTTLTATDLTKFSDVLEEPFEGLPVIVLPKEMPRQIDKSLISYSLNAPTVEYAVEPDPNCLYFVEIKGNATQNRTLKLNLNRHGVMTDGESHVQDKKLELSLAAVESVLRVGVSFVGLGAAGRSLTEGENAKLTGSQRMARLLRQELQTLRSKRSTWLVENPKAEPTAYRGAMADFDQREARILAEFVKEEKEVFPAVFEIRPTFGQGWAVQTTKPLLTWDSDHGISNMIAGADGDVVGPTGIPRAFKAITNGDNSKKLVLTIQRNDAYGPLGAPPEIDEPSGFVYRIPGAVDVSITSYDKDNQLVSLYLTKTMQLPQAGCLAALPRHAGLSPDSLMSLALYEDTGAIKSVNAESKSIDPELIRTFGTNVSESIDKLAAIRKAAAEAAAARPSRLARMTERLKEIAELANAAKEAGITPPPLPNPFTDPGAE